MSDRIPRTGAWVAASVLLVAAPGPRAEPSRALSGLQGWLDGTRDLECRFEQTLESGSLGSGIREGGKLYVKRPGRLRWDYVSPEVKVAIVRDRETLVYLPEDEQLIRGGVDWEGSPLPALLGGEGRLADLFEAAPAGEAGEGRDPRIRLVPRERTEAFAAVTLTLDRRSFAIREVDVLDEAGNRMRFRFRGLRRNRGLDDDLFELTPPPGTEILGSP